MYPKLNRQIEPVQPQPESLEISFRGLRVTASGPTTTAIVAVGGLALLFTGLYWYSKRKR